MNQAGVCECSSFHFTDPWTSLIAAGQHIAKAKIKFAAFKLTLDAQIMIDLYTKLISIKYSDRSTLSFNVKLMLTLESQ